MEESCFQLIPFPEPQIAQMAPRWRKYFVVHSPSGKQYASLFCATQGVALPIPRLPFWPEGSWIQLASFLVWRFRVFNAQSFITLKES
eukprot:g44104.t1